MTDQYRDWAVGWTVLGYNAGWGKTSRPAVGTIQPPVQRVPRVFFPEIKQPGREADHSRAGSEVTNPAISLSFLSILYSIYIFGLGWVGTASWN
jgi:hypothetical protein